MANEIAWINAGGGGAVAFSCSGTLGAFSDTYTASYNLTTVTVDSGSNLVLYAALVTNQDTSSPAATWNGVSMTLVQTVTHASAAFEDLYIFRLVAPATGNQTLAFSWTGNSPSAVCAVAFKNVNQTTPDVVSDRTTNNGTGTSSSTGATTSDTNGATVGFCGAFNGSGGGISVTSTDSQTEAYRQSSSGAEDASAVSYALGGTSNNHQWTISSSQHWCAAGFHLQAA